MINRSHRPVPGTAIALAARNIEIILKTECFPNISKIMRTVTKQKLVSQWDQQNDPLLKHVLDVCHADPALRARKNHLADCEVKGSHPRFDIPTQQSIRFRPTAFMENLLAMLTPDFSPFQLGQCLHLVLGLDYLPPSNSAPVGVNTILRGIIG